MSVAEKLTTIAENQQRVYDAGKRVGFNEGQTDGYAVGHAEGYNQGYTDGEDYGMANGVTLGKQNAYNDFWDNYQQNGNRRNHIGAFAGTGWTDDLFKPKYPIIANPADRMFQSSGLTNVNVPVRILGDSLQSFFQQANILHFEELILTRPTSVASWFSYNTVMQRIRITCEGDGCIGNGGVSCENSGLDHDSLLSIINALQDLVPLGKTYTFTLKTAKSKLSEAEIAIATQKGWTVV